jgi:hypothetical protein
MCALAKYHEAVEVIENEISVDPEYPLSHAHQTQLLTLAE